VVTLGDEIVAETRNRMRGSSDPTAHAEMEAIRAAAAKLGTSRLDDCTLWVTLEPCAMCAAALSIARLKALRFAAEDAKGGGVVHGPRIFSQPTCHHRPDVLGGIGEDEAGALLREFFAERR
jgi:tRNA(Arg) A34 adenosine deaminase TadA